MGKIYDKKPLLKANIEKKKIDINALRKSRIELLKKMIHNEEYMNEAISKLANSLTSGLMK